MSNAERIERWIAEWERAKAIATETCDYKAFERAEREIANYQKLLAEVRQREQAA